MIFNRRKYCSVFKIMGEDVLSYISLDWYHENIIIITKSGTDGFLQRLQWITSMRKWITKRIRMKQLKKKKSWISIKMKLSAQRVVDLSVWNLGWMVEHAFLFSSLSNGSKTPIGTTIATLKRRVSCSQKYITNLPKIRSIFVEACGR